MTDLTNAKIQPRIHSAAKRPLEALVPLDTPMSAHIDISSVCNYKCSFCFQADQAGMKAANLKRGFMPIQLFKKICDDLRDFPDKIKKIKIGNHGEPTLHPNVVDAVAYAQECGNAEIIEMFTNGSKLEPELNYGLVAAGLQRINVSLEGLSDERYLAVAGVRQDFKQIIDGVRDLYAKKQAMKSDLKIYVKIADHAHALKKDSTEVFVLSEKERKYFFDTFQDHCDEIFIEKVVPQWSETQLEKQNEVQDTGMYGQKISAWKEACPFVYMYLHFNCDGTVSPCTLDWPRKVVIGNANDQRVIDIWNGDALRELQIAMLQGHRKCINFCNGCSAPMVCVEENLDPHAEYLVGKLDPTGRYSNAATNQWINNGVSKVEFHR
jgi:radical SAM protein with 4Fe4S-binding SPASM domain